jgi:hypothetical protein
VTYETYETYETKVAGGAAVVLSKQRESGGG